MPNEPKAADKQPSQMNGAVKGQSSQALVLQTYASALDRQPMIKLDSGTALTKFEAPMNKALADAKANAATYLGTIQPAAMGTLTRVDRYINMQLSLQKLVDRRLDRGDRIETDNLLDMLKTMQAQVEQFQSEADAVRSSLDTLRKSLSNDAGSFQGLSQELGVVAQADQGVLAQLEADIKNIDGKMGAAIAGAAISGIAIAGGAFLVAIGGFSGIVTGGASTALVVVGGAILVGGIAGAVGSGVGIGLLVKQKNELLQAQTRLKAEIKFAQGLSGSFSLLSDGATASATAAKQMANAWSDLYGHLGNLASDIKLAKDIDMRDLFLETALYDADDVKVDLRTIHAQFAGVKIVEHPESAANASLEGMISQAQAQLANDNALPAKTA